MVTHEPLLPMDTTAGGAQNQLLEESPFAHASSPAGVNAQGGKNQAGKSVTPTSARGTIVFIL